MKRRGSNGDESSRLVVEPAKSRLRTFLSNSEKIDFSTQEEYKYDEPIADLFPETTIMFADIAGFTAWSSEREPSQVFYLLETLYRAFDKIASRLGVFKVETIGDCYVAVTGLPDQRKVSIVFEPYRCCNIAIVCMTMKKKILTDTTCSLLILSSSIGSRCGDGALLL